MADKSQTDRLRPGPSAMVPLLLAMGLTWLDQATKIWVRTDFALSESRPVIEGFFKFSYLRNPGAAWGMFSGHSMWLTLLSFIMLALVVLFRRSFLSDTWEHRIALGFMSGGILGNLMDRVRWGYVVDFLDFRIFGYPWPVFNVADSAICIGVGLYIVSSFWMKAHPLHESRTPARSK
jgi:signal peptidase II